jgi:hypothetical protein
MDKDSAWIVYIDSVMVEAKFKYMRLNEEDS